MGVNFFFATMQYIQSSRYSRVGITMIEMTVVISIIVILLGLLLAGVQKTRSASQRTTCGNNVRQLTLAIQSLHATFGRFPEGVKPDQPEELTPYMNWHVLCLPFAQQSNLWYEIQHAYHVERRFTYNPPHVWLARSLPLFACPSDPRVASAQFIKTGAPRGLTSYIGVDGTSAARADGLLFMGSKIANNDIRDGLSHTLLIGERPPSADYVLGWWYAGWGLNKDGEGDSVLGVRTQNLGSPYVRDCPPGPFAFTRGQVSDQCSALHFWSLHSGGAHFAFADGSVRFLSYSADSVLPALATRAGGEVVEVS